MLGKILMFLPFHLILKPLIKRNYRLRFKSAMNGDGKHPDEWYWADSLAVKYGYFVSRSHRYDKKVYAKGDVLYVIGESTIEIEFPEKAINHPFDRITHRNP